MGVYMNNLMSKLWIFFYYMWWSNCIAWPKKKERKKTKRNTVTYSNISLDHLLARITTRIHIYIDSFKLWNGSTHVFVQYIANFSPISSINEKKKSYHLISSLLHPINSQWDCGQVDAMVPMDLNIIILKYAITSMKEVMN